MFFRKKDSSLPPEFFLKNYMFTTHPKFNMELLWKIDGFPSSEHRKIPEAHDKLTQLLEAQRPIELLVGDTEGKEGKNNKSQSNPGENDHCR